jgi:hypothetical protein
MCHNGEISGVVEDSRHRRFPIASGGLEVKLKLTFKLKGLGDIVYKMKQLVREAYTWEYTGEQPDRDEPVPLKEDYEEEIDL